MEFWGNCQGYDRRPGDPTTGASVDYRAPTAVRPLAPAITNGPSIVTHVFDDEVEQRYFQIFAQEYAPRTVLSGTFNSIGLLTYLIPQACWTEPAIRRGCIALGALRLGQDQEFSDRTISKRWDSNQLYEYALEQYQRAIGSMREVKRIRTALIACLMIFCIEMSLRHPDIAMRQMLSGLKLVEQYECCAESVYIGTEDKVEGDLIAAFRTLEIRKSRHIYHYAIY